MKTVLFACVHNAGRSQMAAAWFNVLADPDKARALSAGTVPASLVHPEVVEVMREVGIDLATQQPKLLTEELAREAALLITMGCGEACPILPTAMRLDWPLEDPKGKPPERVREICADVRARVMKLLVEQGWARAVDIHPLGEAELPAVRMLLEPTHGAGQLNGFYVARTSGRVIGSIGVEQHGNSGLLRSLVVDTAQQKTGVASALVHRAIEHATQRRLKALYLLTTSAPRFFEKHGFSTCPRSEAPPQIEACWEFRTGCPSPPPSCAATSATDHPPPPRTRQEQRQRQS